VYRADMVHFGDILHIVSIVPMCNQQPDDSCSLIPYCTTLYHMRAWHGYCKYVENRTVNSKAKTLRD
jgi:hypothetical protein